MARSAGSSLLLSCALLGSVCQLALLVVGCHPPCPAARPAEPRASNAASAPRVPAYGPIRVALTVDDLPGTVDATPGYPKSQVMADLIATLRAHGIQRVVGFANGVAVNDADTELALARWLEAGFEIGNHTFSHLSAREAGATAFLDDVAHNQRYLAQRTGTPPHYFRFPFLERGETEEDRLAITRALAREGYRVANVSIDFADWAFVPAYARCGAAGNQAALTALSEAYLQNAALALFWSVETAQRLLGRSVPQVLLLHAQVPTARNLEALLTLYEQQGVTWITLEEALRDPLYAEPPELDHGDTSALVEVIRQQHADLRSSAPRPLALLELACR